MNIYNQLYNNDNYVTLARLIAYAMNENFDNPSQEYLAVMIDIQDRAIGYSRLESQRPNIPLVVTGNNAVWKAYLDFMRPYSKYYNDNI